MCISKRLLGGAGTVLRHCEGSTSSEPGEVSLHLDSNQKQGKKKKKCYCYVNRTFRGIRIISLTSLSPGSKYLGPDSDLPMEIKTCGYAVKLNAF